MDLNITILKLFVLAFMILAAVAGVVNLSNNKVADGILGNYNATGAAIILIGIPYLMIQLYNIPVSSASYNSLDTF